jgi:CTP:molybdopterin cytidylyltransferase MocA
VTQPTVEFYLLAAGKGKRMGGSKPLLAFGETTVFERMISAIRTAGVTEVRIVVAQGNSRLTELATKLGVRVIINAAPEEGMSSSIKLTLDDCSSEWLALCPADMPLLTSDAIAYCVHRLGENDLQPTCGGRRKHPVFLRAKHKPLVLRALSGGTLRDYLAWAVVDKVECEPCIQFEDFDTPEEYERLLRQLG